MFIVREIKLLNKIGNRRKIENAERINEETTIREFRDPTQLPEIIYQRMMVSVRRLKHYAKCESGKYSTGKIGTLFLFLYFYLFL